MPDHTASTRAESTWLVGPCDGCGGEMPERGWMKPTGSTFEGLPVYRFYCSCDCIDRENHNG